MTPIKQTIRASGITQWRIAEFLNISEAVFSRKLRHEPDETFRAQIEEAIRTLSNEKN